MKGSWKLKEDVDAMWKGMAQCIRRSAKEVVGVSRVGCSRIKGASWWNEEVKEK